MLVHRELVVMHAAVQFAVQEATLSVRFLKQAPPLPALQPPVQPPVVPVVQQALARGADDRVASSADQLSSDTMQQAWGPAVRATFATTCTGRELFRYITLRIRHVGSTFYTQSFFLSESLCIREKHCSHEFFVSPRQMQTSCEMYR